MAELPSNIFCQFVNCNSIYIVHHRASDIQTKLPLLCFNTNLLVLRQGSMISYQNILEACNNPQKRGKRGNEASKTPSNPEYEQRDTSNSHESLSTVDGDVNSSGELTKNSSCCGPLSNGKHKNGSAKDLKTSEESFTKYNNYNKRIMRQPAILPCNHGYCQECVTHMTDMVSSLSLLLRFSSLTLSMYAMCVLAPSH
jgi:hypothetical protein